MIKALAITALCAVPMALVMYVVNVAAAALSTVNVLP